MELDQHSRDQLNLLLYQLSQLIDTPPLPIDHLVWLDDIDGKMKGIQHISQHVFEQLVDLIVELQKRGEEHVKDIDDDETPHVIEQSGRRYYEQACFVHSEINRLKY